MKGARGWVFLAAVAIVIAAAAYLLQPKQDSPEHSSSSDAANGSSAVLLYAQAMGHPSSQITGSFVLPNAGSMMFVFTPTSPYTADDADRTRSWVSSGGTVVYASEQGDPELDRVLGVSRYGVAVESGVYKANPVLGGVDRVAGGTGGVLPMGPSAKQVTFLRTAQGLSVGFIEKIGLGYSVVLADPLH